MNYQKGRHKKRVNGGEKGQNQQDFPRLFSSLSLNSLQLKANWFYLPLTFLLVLGLVGCGGKSPTTSQSDDADSSPKESNLTFFDVTLEQADEVGRPVWKVRSKKAIYTQEKQIGQAEKPVGELYQDGKPIYQIQADKADIEQDGQKLFLKGKILATDPVNGIVLQGNELEWLPQEDLLIVRNQINGTHKQLKAVAQEARVKTREQRIEFSGGVIANSVDPQMQMRSENLTWRIKEEILTSDRSIQIDRYNNNKITDSGKGDAAEVNLKTKIATIKKNAQLNLVDPPTQIVSNSMTWDMNAETVKTNSPITVVQRAENVTVTANKGEMKIQQKIVNLTGNVTAIGQRRQSLKSNKLIWYLDKKLLEAQGNVIYRQIDPPINFTGETAVGNLQTEDIVVKSGTSGRRVVTEIIPQDAGIQN
ncbi:LPS export ABC transporter periplasmic protein LptC [Nodularia spumigena CS-588/02]|uniref:LPS export ABC transporter periplasmic protein LptC n=1 Tax=Nodularia spumigena TaxID=70799 RepID=UPI00232BF10D|nr:LPS export ABC transporter periplasmic protein LptC [Nodularia spumigena]MDB9360792.1 LPS export ABC transporter periplasmic protein LptC [Nodularia spumigena CS-588/02]MDB9367064.1 LPS export ABC transporter periplasmic protein LptC [Nodularia spumigena CS-588/02A10]